MNIDDLNVDDFEEEALEETDGKETDNDNLDDDSTVEEDLSEDNENAKAQDNEDNEKLRKKNSHYAEMRREKERKEREEREARENKIKEDTKLETKLGIIKKNPYTNTDIVDEEDLKVYELQQKIEEEGGDPIEDLPKKIAQINRERKKAEEAKNKEQLERQEALKRDIDNFHKEYPKVDLEKLANDEEFIKFSSDKVGRWTTKEIYEAYKSRIVDKKEKEIKDKTIDENSKRLTKTPSSIGTGNIPAKKISDMTDEEFEKYWSENYGK